MTTRGRPRDDCPSSDAERVRRYRDRKRRGVSVLPPIEISAERKLQLAAMLGLPCDASPTDIAAAISNISVAVTHNEKVD